MVLLRFNSSQFGFPLPPVCSSNLAHNTTCILNTPESILVSNLFPTASFTAGDNLTISIENCLLNVTEKVLTSSWNISTLTVDGYAIDRVDQGLSINFSCNAPCLTCSSESPSVCLSCNALTGTPILY